MPENPLEYFILTGNQNNQIRVFLDWCCKMFSDWTYLPPIIAFDAILACSVWRLLDFRTPRKLSYIRRIYLAGTAMVIVLLAIRLAAG